MYNKTMHVFSNNQCSSKANVGNKNETKENLKYVRIFIDHMFLEFRMCIFRDAQHKKTTEWNSFAYFLKN